MGALVKICGLADAQDVEAVVSYEPDAMGFVLWEQSPRGVSAEAVKTWTAGLEAPMQKVGVFVDPDLDELQRAVDIAGLDVVQIHYPSKGVDVRADDLEQWVALKLDADDDFNAVAAAEAEKFLIDSGTREMPGGTGIVGDWDLAADFVSRCDREVWLAGGLTPENVAEAILRVKPYGVDVSSGVEARPGKKDLGLVKAFIEASRSV